MSLLMGIVLAILIVEITAVVVILMPLPPKVQESIINALHAALENNNFRIGMYFVLIIVGMMFSDAAKNSFQYGHESGFVAESMGGRGVSQSIWDVRIKKYYAQRNMYITGAVLFLLLAIYFLVRLLKSMVKNKKKLVAATASGKQAVEAGEEAGDVSTLEYEQLEDELKRKETDVAALKQQVKNLEKEYQRKADEVAPEVDAEDKKEA